MLEITSDVEIVNVRRRQRRSMETRNRILNAAVKEFGRCGLLGASTRLIAKDAGVDHGLITHHFGSKEGLWSTVISTTLGEIVEKLREAVNDPVISSATERLMIYQERFIRFVSARPYFTAIMSHARTITDGKASWTFDSETAWINSQMMDLIRKAQAEGNYITGDPAHLLFLFFGAAARVHMVQAEAEQLIGKSLSSDEFVDEHVRLCRQLFFRNLDKVGLERS